MILVNYVAMLLHNKNKSESDILLEYVTNKMTLMLLLFPINALNDQC